MPTSPASDPFRASVRSGFLYLTQEVIMAAMAPALAARVVVMAIRATVPGSPMPSVEPALKPYQPNQRMNTPIVTSGMLCPPIALAEPSLLNRPKRGPSNHAATRAVMPPTAWTTVEPAKS